MYPVSEKFLTAVRSNTRNYYWTGTIITKAGISHTFGARDIVKGSGYLTNQCCGNEEIELGAVYAAELGITLFSDIDRYTLEGAFITLEFHLVFADSTEEMVPMGIFEISEANRTIHCLEIKAYDYMLRFDKSFQNKVTGGTAFDLLSLACEACKVELAHTKEEMDGWKNGTILLGIYSENDIETWRDILFYVAQVLGKFCTINREGKLELRSYGETSVMDIPNTQRFTSSFSDFVTRYTAISSTNRKTQTAEYYALETDDALTMNLGVNPLLQFGLEETRRDLLLNILEEISRIRYVPFDSTTIGNPAFDLGDVITFSGGHADGTQITCITKYEYKINGRHTLKCVGKNPRLSGAKSKSDKNISGLLNQIEAGKIVTHTYTNASPYKLGAADTEVCNLEFAANEDTDAQFHASILIEVTSEKRTVTATGKREIPPDPAPNPEGQPGKTAEVLPPKIEEFPITFEEDGTTILTVTYIKNDEVLTTYVPVETFFSGKHILNLYYPLADLKANTYNTFRVRIKLTGGSALVGRGQAICTISGQGLSAARNWDGRLNIEELFDVKLIPGGIKVANMLVAVETHTEVPEPVGVGDRAPVCRFGGVRVSAFQDAIQVNPVVVTETIEPADREEMIFAREYVLSDTAFIVNTKYSFRGKEATIDRGRMTKMEIPSENFARIDVWEVKHG